MKRMLIVAMIAVFLGSIFAKNSNAANAKASFLYSCNLSRDSQLLLFTFEPSLKKRGWAVVDELQKLGWKKKDLGSFAYSPGFNPNIRAIRMDKVNGVLAIRIDGDWMSISLQSTSGSMRSPEEIAKIINDFFRQLPGTSPQEE